MLSFYLRQEFFVLQWNSTDRIAGFFHERILLFDPSVTSHPLHAIVHPLFIRGFLQVSVFSLRIDMQLCRDTVPSQGLVKQQAVLYRHYGIVVGVCQIGGRCGGGDLLLVGKTLDLLLGRSGTQQHLARSSMSDTIAARDNGIDQQHEIGTQAGPLRVIYDRVVIVGTGSSRHVATGREAHYPDLVWIYSPLCGMFAYYLNGPLCIL